MEERELGITPRFESAEAASTALLKAVSLTQKALENEPSGGQRDFHNGLLENLQGAKAWLDTKIARRKFLTLTSELVLATTFLTSCAPLVAESVMPITDGSNRTTTEVSTMNGAISTEAPTQISTILPTAKPTEYRVEAAGGAYSDAQIEINNSESAKDQESRIKRWLDYWINFDNRPFAPNTAEISWKYIYDNPESPKETMVMIEAGGEYQGKTFTVPIFNSFFAEYPPQVKGNNIAVNYGPLELTGGGVGQWLSVEQGIPVRKDTNSNIVEKLNMATGKWEAAKPKIVAEIRTTENFLDHEVAVESLFDGSYLEALRKISTPFDSTKIKNVPLVNYSDYGNTDSAGDNEIAYSRDNQFINHTINFPNEEMRPFRRFITGYITYQGSTYAVVPTEYYNWGHPDKNVWVITLYRFDKYDTTDDGKMASMKVWENGMNITPIISTNCIPGTKTPDSLVAKTFAKSDIQKRIADFVNHNGPKPDGSRTSMPWKNGGDLTALDGEVFLTRIMDGNYWYQ